MDATLRLQTHWFIGMSRREIERRITRAKALAMIQHGERLPAVPMAEAWLFLAAVWMMPLAMWERLKKARQKFILHFFDEVRRCAYTTDGTLIVEYLNATVSIMISLALLKTRMPLIVPLYGVASGMLHFYAIARGNEDDRAEACVLGLLFWCANLLIWFVYFGHPHLIHGFLAPLAFSMWIAIFSLRHRGGGIDGRPASD